MTATSPRRPRANASTSKEWAQHGEWNPDRLVFYSAEVVSMLLKPYPRDRQVHTVQELQMAVEESGLPAFRVWIHKGLRKRQGEFGRNRVPRPEGG